MSSLAVLRLGGKEREAPGGDEESAATKNGKRLNIDVFVSVPRKQQFKEVCQNNDDASHDDEREKERKSERKEERLRIEGVYVGEHSSRRIQGKQKEKEKEWTRKEKENEVKAGSKQTRRKI